MCLNFKDKEDAQLIPLRWSPAETIFEHKVSYKTDVCMLGNLFYEVKTHGVLPYSAECADDEIFIEKVSVFGRISISY